MTGGDAWMELRVMARSLTRRPGYVAATVATLALGIGVAGSIYSLVTASLLAPLPYHAPERLVQARDFYRPTNGSGGMSVPNFTDLASATRTLETLAPYQHASFNLATEAAPQRVAGLRTTSAFLSALGVELSLGRNLHPDEDGPGAPAAVVVSHRIWRERLGGAPDVLGRNLRLDGVPHEVVGVLPADFWYIADPDVLVPGRWDPSTSSRGNRSLEGLGRLGAGNTLEASQEELRSIFARIAGEYPDGNEGWTVRLLPLSEYALGGNKKAFQLLAGAAAMVLLIGCVNVANLMLVRAERRQRETAVRAALGAGRRRLAHQLVGESLILSVAAGAVGIALTWAGTRALVAVWGTTLPRVDRVGIDGQVIAFVGALSLTAGLLLGLIPTLTLDTRRLQEMLRSGAAAGVGGRRRMESLLVWTEVALAVLLATGAGLLIKSGWQASRVDTGIEMEGAAAFQVQLHDASYPESEDIARFYRTAVEEIAVLPGVSAVGITDRPPVRGGYNITTLQSPLDEERVSSFVEIRRVTPGFFEASGIPLIRGRLLTEADGMDEAEVVVISQRLADDLFGEVDPIGRVVGPGWNEDGYTVVGVVGSVREFGLLGDVRPALYWPYPVPNTPAGMTFVYRAERGDPLTLLPEIREVVRRLDPTIPIYGAASLEDVVLGTLGSRRLAASLFATFAALSLLLAALGVFSVLAYSVERRTREIGVRMAMGAARPGVVRLVVLQGMRLAAVGLAAGGFAAFFGGRLLSDLLHEVEPSDPATIGVVMVVVLGTSFFAAWLPARRAAGVQPIIALRQE